MMHMMNTLDLTAEQREAIRKIKNDTREQMGAKRDEMFEIRKALREQGRAETYDAAKVRELADAKAKIMADMTVQRVKTMHQIRKELTPEQIKQLNEMKEHRFGHHGF
jgi:Spy/CpxP family protein refolding chaperone